MNQQSEALLMAEHLDDRGLIEEAAELRRLHDENESLLNALQNMCEGFHILKDSDFPALAKARATISAMKGQS